MKDDIYTIDLTEDEVIQVGADRWEELHKRRFFLPLVLLLAVAIPLAILSPPDPPLYYVIPIAAILASLWFTLHWFTFLKPVNKAGKDFLRVQTKKEL